MKRGNREIQLSSKEFSLLRYMMQNKGIVLSRDTLEQHIYSFDFSGGSNVIDVYIRYLRRKIDDGEDEKLIHTIRGQGYVLRIHHETIFYSCKTNTTLYSFIYHYRMHYFRNSFFFRRTADTYKCQTYIRRTCIFFFKKKFILMMEK